jgi:iron complex transport system substrate-binding protein
MKGAMILARMALAIVALAAPAWAQTRQILDLAGNPVTVPAQIRKVYAPSPYGSYLIYAVAPDRLAGLIFPLKEEDKPFLNPVVWNLPVIGGRFGGGVTTNLEVLLKAKPDLILLWAERNNSFTSHADDQLRQFAIPCATVLLDGLREYPQAFTFLGALLGQEARGQRLAAYCRETFASVDAALQRIPKSRRPRVYYAEGLDGLSTECDDSMHVELLRMAGDLDVFHCRTGSAMGMEKVSLEQVLMLDPEVLVVQEKGFFDKVFSDPAWKRIKAVREGRVFLVPRSPFNWFDRPPSFMRVLGLKWLMHNLYSKEYPIDIVQEARAFYSLFLGVQVSEADMKRILWR